jgi:acetoin utilization deacetylase AcuC-like enzyme
MKVVCSPRYRIDIGPHVFPTQKYALVHARLRQAGVVQPSDVLEPQPASWDDLALVHTAEYLAKMREGTLSDEEVLQLELPWSREMVDGFRVMVGHPRWRRRSESRPVRRSESDPV